MMYRLQNLIVSSTLFTVTAFSMASMGAAEAADSPAWQLQQAVNAPEWLKLSGSFRTRFENMDERFRSGRNGSDQALVTRLTFKSEIELADFSVAAELLDARAFFNDADSNISTTVVNSTELLQGYLRWRTNDLISADSISTLTAGRMTIDVGSRRLVARNRYRNTINHFTGIDWRWQSRAKREFRAFYLLPINRLPADRESLLDNDAEFDDESTDVSFWGVYYQTPVWLNDQLELYLFGLDEDDSFDRPTRNRDILTTGFRLWRKPSISKFDYMLESAYQFGDSRSSTATTNTTDLDHSAYFHHAEVGYSFAFPWQPQLIFQYDHISGDDDPTDADNNRFDTLFGARRFEWGPTGIYGPFARANLITPGIRLKLNPSNRISSFIAYRGYWLASDKDAFTVAGLRDTSGNSDRFLGHQLEMRIRYNPSIKNVKLEGGFAQLFTGDFVKDTVNKREDITYIYSQLSLSF